ncbi:MAG: DUF4428 domain-containing protein [Eggerthellaceae bacterium]|nr:DUF4428 domain-containing protein [Eggerthellaceae bacterium]
MGLFGKDKKLCLACGQKTGFMRAGLEIEGGWLCSDCKEKLSPYVEQVPIHPFGTNHPVTPFTIEGYRAHLAWREECKALDAVFVPEERYDDPTNGEPLFEVDRTHGLFRVLRASGAHADVMRLTDLRDTHAVVVQYLDDERDGDGTAVTRRHYYYFNMRIGADLPLMQRAEFVACAWYVYGGQDTRKLPGGYGPEGQTTMKEHDKREYEWRLAECQKLALAFTGQAGPPELRVTEELPSQCRPYRAGAMPRVNKFGPEIR